MKPSTPNATTHASPQLQAEKGTPPPPDTRVQRAFDRIPLRLAQLAVSPSILRNAIRRRLEPEIHRDRDFGNIRNKGVQQQVIALNAREASLCLKSASRRGQPVHIAAARHSSNGHTLAPQGSIQLQLNPKDWGEARWVDDEYLQIPACMRWREVEAIAQLAGRTIPVLTDHLGTTVGGTLSVGGGIGSRSVVAGRQIDHITRLRLIFPNGEARWIGPTSNQELFRFVLGGQGTLGIIDRVVVHTHRYRAYTTEYKLQFRSLVDAAQAAENFCNRVDTPKSFTRLDFVGPLLNTKVVELSLGFESATQSEARRLLKAPAAGILHHKGRIVKRQFVRHMAHHNNARSSAYLSTLTRKANPHCFYWNDFFFPEINAYLGFLSYLESSFFVKTGNQYLMAALGLAYGPDQCTQHFPLSGLESIPGQRGWSIGLNYAVPQNNDLQCHRMRRALMEAQAACHDHGGRVYRYGYSDATATELSQIYGKDYARLQALKAKLDPQGLLNPGVLGLGPPA